MNKKPDIVVVIPCYNEEKTIEQVIKDFKRELPNSRIMVVDNNSFDSTSEIAKKSGAEVVFEKKQGKGFAIQTAFRVFDGDIFVLVDGDDTYNAKDVHKLLDCVMNENIDMAVGNRMHKGNMNAFSKRHWYGNKFLTGVLNVLFRVHIQDMQSGLRVMNKEYVDTTALLIGGFAIEPELTIQAIEKNMFIKELPIDLGKRPKGSHSKINAVRDGTIALYTLLSLFRDYQPLQFFTFVSVVLMLLSVGLGVFSLDGYFETGMISRVPSLVVAGFLMIASIISFISGLILSSIKRRHDELVVFLRRLHDKK